MKKVRRQTKLRPIGWRRSAARDRGEDVVTVHQLGEKPAAGRPACAKCGNTSGDDWRQCRDACPMEGSPHYSQRCAAAYARKATP